MARAAKAVSKTTKRLTALLPPSGRSCLAEQRHGGAHAHGRQRDGPSRAHSSTCSHRPTPSPPSSLSPPTSGFCLQQSILRTQTMYEVIGRVQPDGTVMEMMSTPLGDNFGPSGPPAAPHSPCAPRVRTTRSHPNTRPSPAVRTTRHRPRGLTLPFPAPRRAAILRCGAVRRPPARDPAGPGDVPLSLSDRGAVAQLPRPRALLLAHLCTEC